MSSAFPASKYSRYKRATAFFLDWLLRARGRGRHTGSRIQLQQLSGLVEEIAAEPSSLSPQLLCQLPKALAACQCAITLRDHVAAYFGEDADEGHQHFLGLLRRWLDALKAVEVAQQEAPLESQRTTFESYYDVLQLDEDFFPDEERAFGAAGVPRRAKADRKKLLEEAFAEDLRLELVCYFLELEELVDGVFDVYDQVKKQKRTLVEATVVAKVAMDTVSSLTAQLQLKYPALKTAEDVITMIRTHIPEKVQRRITEAVSDARQKFEEGEPFTPVPGMLLMDFENVLYTLNTIAGLFPEMPKGGKVLLFLDVSLGASYGEERTPEYVLPDPSTDMVILIAQQLPMLYSAFADRIAETGSGFDRIGGLASSFMRLMEEYFRSRKATVEVVLACVFWMKSVVALQGNADLGRNVSLTFKHSTRLMGIMEAWLERRPEANVQYSKRFIAVLKECGRGQQVARANPLMAGFLELDNDLQFLRIANDLAMAASIFRAFGHLYNALVNEGYLGRIPFFDDVLDIYEQMIFTPSQATAVRGAYYRTYLLSRGFSTTGVRAVYRGAVSSRSESFRDRKKPHTEDLSQIYRLLHERDTSVLKGTSPKDLLAKVADICAKELFETRVLSRDMVTLNDDLADTLCEMFDELSEGYLDQLPDPVPGESQKARVNRALENLMPVLGLLDSLQLDGTMDLSMIPAEARYEDVGNMRVHEGCRKISAVIKAKFSSSPHFCEEKYFTYPAQPDFVRQEYGSASLKGDFEKANREKVFCELMNLLQTNNGPLGESDLDHLQAEIKKDPVLLSMVCPHSESDKDCSMPGFDVTSSSDNDLCTLFHQAAAGPAHDLYLVEWMIQMGALVNQPLHCRTKTRQRNVKHDGVILSNAMAVHSAAIAGFKDIVCTIVGADNMMHLNTSTFYTSETLAHLAVKHGHRSLYELLASVGADLSLRDGNGKRVCDLTTDQEWRYEMVSSILRRKTSLGSTKDKAHGEALMEELRQSVSPHLEKKLQRSVSSSSKRKAKEKQRGGANGSANASEFSSTAVSDAIAAKLSGQTKQLLLSSNLACDEKDAENSSNRNAELHDLFNNAGATFQRLSDPSIPADMKVEDEERTCKLVIQLESVAKFLSHPNRLNATDPSLRVFVAKKSFETIHMMQKLHRVTQPALTVPLLGPVKELCDTTLDFTEFVVGTAQLLASFSRNSQAREILDVLEKRLLKTPFDKRKPSEFRALVQMYSSARDTMGMGSTSSSKTFRALEWYLTNTVGNTELQDKLDGMIGHPVYFDLTPTAETTNQQFDEFKSAIEGIPELSGVVCLTREGKRVMYGGSNKMDVKRVRGSVMAAAEGVGVRFGGEGSQDFTSAVSVGEFVISIGGASRNAVAA